MANASVKEMLQAGLHFGHQTRRWNPKMKPYIYGPRNGIYIINLDISKRMFDKACDFITNEIAAGGALLFVFAFGMGAVLLAVGTFSGLMTSIPRSGPWMVKIKKVLGLFMIVLAQYFLVKAGMMFV